MRELFELISELQWDNGIPEVDIFTNGLIELKPSLSRELLAVFPEIIIDYKLSGSGNFTKSLADCWKDLRVYVKFVVSNQEDVAEMLRIIEYPEQHGIPEKTSFLVTPVWNRPIIPIIHAIMEKKHPELRLALQQHKYWHIK